MNVLGASIPLPSVFLDPLQDHAPHLLLIGLDDAKEPVLRQRTDVDCPDIFRSPLPPIINGSILLPLREIVKPTSNVQARLIERLVVNTVFFDSQVPVFTIPVGKGGQYKGAGLPQPAVGQILQNELVGRNEVLFRILRCAYKER